LGNAKGLARNSAPNKLRCEFSYETLAWRGSGVRDLRLAVGRKRARPHDSDCSQSDCGPRWIDKQWACDRTVDRATRAEFRERSLHSVVDRRETRRGHSTEPTLRRRPRSRTTCGGRARAAEYSSAPADVDRRENKIGPGLYFHRRVGRRPADSAAVEFLHADGASESKLGGSAPTERRRSYFFRRKRRTPVMAAPPKSKIDMVVGSGTARSSKALMVGA
jgi:hypothetical protein